MSAKLFILWLPLCFSSLVWSDPLDYTTIPEWAPAQGVLMASPTCRSYDPARMNNIKEKEEIENLARKISQEKRIIFATNERCLNYFTKKFRNYPNIKVMLSLRNEYWTRDTSPLWARRKRDGKVVAQPIKSGYSPEDHQKLIYSEFDVEKSPKLWIADPVQGGNLLVDENGNCFSTQKFYENVNEYLDLYAQRRLDEIPDDGFNWHPAYQSKEENVYVFSINLERAKKYGKQATYDGCKKNYWMPYSSYEQTKHIDMFVKLLPGKKALVSHYIPDSAYVVEIKELNKVTQKHKEILISAGYSVEMLDTQYSREYLREKEKDVHYSYANAFLLEKVAYVPQYGNKELDRKAIDAYAKYGFRVVPVEMNDIAKRLGSVHCVTSAVPR